MSVLHGERCVVTGGAGFVGQNVVAALRERGALVCVLDRVPHPSGGLEQVIGDVADPATAEDLRELVTQFVGENEVVLNRLSIRAPTQVNLRVRVAEMSRDVTKIFGISWDNALAFGDFALGLSTGRPFAAANTVSGSFENDNLTIDGVIDALEREGLVTVLAEPNLTALSGETASFLAGGEFPVPVGTENNDIQIEFKQFGVVNHVAFVQENY